MEHKSDAFDQQFDRRSEPSPTIATIMLQTKQSPPSDRVTQSPPGVGSEPTPESDSDLKHTKNLKRVTSQDEPKRRRDMEHKSDALEQPFDHRSEQFTHDSDNNLARMEDSTARFGHALPPAAEDILEPESEPESDYDAQIDQHIRLGFQKITENWGIKSAKLKKILGESPSRGVIALAVKFSKLVKFHKAWPQLELVQNERRSGGPKASSDASVKSTARRSNAACFPRDLHRAMGLCGIDGSSDTAAQDDQPQDERLDAQSKAHNDPNRGNTKHKRENAMCPTRGAGWSSTKSLNRGKRLKINTTESSISVVVPELTRSDGSAPKVRSPSCSRTTFTANVFSTRATTLKTATL